QIVKKYVAPSDYSNLKQDIKSYLQGNQSELRTISEGDAGLLSLCNSSRIKIDPAIQDWVQSIYTAGEPLLASSSIEKHYLDTIIEQIRSYGLYMFLNDDVILAHAKPEDGVNHLDIAFMITPNGVPFSEERHAKLIIILAAEDQEKHLPILQDILSLVSSEDFLQQLYKCTTPELALTLMKAYIS
ncbi:MAG: PTS sugar transporter subunit IIA, partial [Eubacteriales bacterium]|nr:PTS sugar transporter subunit IIA [Eubacteriales bacterium]